MTCGEMVRRREFMKLVAYLAMKLGSVKAVYQFLYV